MGRLTLPHITKTAGIALIVVVLVNITAGETLHLSGKLREHTNEYQRTYCDLYRGVRVSLPMQDIMFHTLKFLQDGKQIFRKIRYGSEGTTRNGSAHVKSCGTRKGRNGGYC